MQDEAQSESVRQTPEPRRPRELRIRLPQFRLKTLLVLAVIACLAGIAALFLISNSSRDPFPESVKQQAHFPLYYPTELPEGFRFDQAAYDASVNVMTYDYSTPDGNRIYFSLQPKPKKFDFDRFNKKQLTGTSQVETPVGTATVGVLQEQTVSSVVTDKTWVLITSGEKVSLQQLQQVSQSLRPVK